MENKTFNYQNGKIYRIVCNITGETYIGSTTQPKLSMRKAQHVNKFKRWQNKIDGFNSSFHIIQRGNYDMVLIENYPCESKEQLHTRERYWIENTNNCINKIIPTRTLKEWYNVNKTKISEYHKKYEEKNKTKRQEQHKINYEQNKSKNLEKWKTKFNCECGGKYTNSGKSHHFKTKIHINFIEKQNVGTI
jgi:hypothetical protein